MPKKDERLDLTHLTRRDVLRAGMVAGGSIALAGCSGGGGDGTDTPADTDSGGTDTPADTDSGGDGGSDGGTTTDVNTPNERVDKRLTVSHQSAAGPIPELNWNVYAPGGYPWGGRSIGRLTHVEFSIYSPQTGDEYYILGDSWEMVDDTTVELTLKDDIQWHDGTEITTDDIAVEERINDALVEATGEATGGGYGLSSSQFIDDWNVVDDKTWQYGLNEPYAESFVQQNIVKKDMEIKADVYESYAEEMEDLLEDGDSDGAQQAAQDLLEEVIPNEETYGNGPFKYKSHTDTEYVLEAYDDYVYSDNIFFDEVAFEEFESNVEAFLNGQTDVYNGSLNSTQQNRAPETIKTGKQRLKMRGVHMNMGLWDQASDFSEAVEGGYEPITREPDGWLVRKAIAYALGPEQLAQAMDKDATPMTDYPQSAYPYAMWNNNSGPVDSSWLNENLENYSERQPDKAEEHLREAGMEHSEDEGTWLDWNGDPVEITVLARANPLEEQVIKQHLEDIGFAVTLNSTENFGSARWQGRFDVMPDSGTGTAASIFSSFPKSDWHSGMYHGPRGTNDDYGWPVPPVGDTEMTDPSERMDYVQGDDFEEYLTTGSTDALKRMMWSANQFLPTFNFAYFTKTKALNAEEWQIDAPAGLLNAARVGYFNALKHEDGTLTPR
jgi:peptide/nickel transport system substrate-binding protein